MYNNSFKLLVFVDGADDDDYTDVQPDARKLQWDALDTVEKYMNNEETTPIIPEREQTVEQPEKEETVIKIVENNHVEPKIEKEQTQRKGYENVSKQNYENALPIGKTDESEQDLTVEQRRLSYEKKQLSKTDSGPTVVPAQSISITKGTTSPPLSPTKPLSVNLPFPPTVPRTTIESQAPLSGPRFVQSSIAQQGGKTHSSIQPSGPCGSTESTLQTSLSQEREKDQSTKKDSESKPKFKTVITVGGMNPSITLVNKAQHTAGGTQGSVNRPHNLPNSNNDYEMAFPVDDANRKSLNTVTINSNSSAVYAVAGKMKETTPENPSNIYTEVNKVKEVKAVPAQSPYETISSRTEPIKSAPKSRAYEEITLTSDGVYSTGKYYWKELLEL